MSEHANTPPPADRSAPLGTDLRVAIARVSSRFRSERSEGEIGDAALGALNALQKHGPLSLKDLSERARVTPGSMSQTVNRLTTGGLAVRSRDADDGRRVLFTSTPAGDALAAAAMARRQDWLDAALEQLTPAERNLLEQAVPVLRKIAEI